MTDQWLKLSQAFANPEQRSFHNEHFFKVDLSTIHIANLNWHQCSFQHSSFSGSDLDQAFWANTLLGRCDLKSTVLTGILADVQVVYCNGTQLQIRNSSIQRTRFVDTPLMRADFSGSTLTRVEFDHSDLYGANFQGARLFHVRFTDHLLEGASLVKADFRDSILFDIDMSYANLNNARFDGALLFQVNLYGALLPENFKQFTRLFNLSSAYRQETLPVPVQ